MTGNIKRRFGDCIRWEGESMKKKWVSGMLALLLVGTTVGSMMPTEAVQAEENSQGKTYYVDSENGKIQTTDFLKEKHFRH